MSAVSYTAFGQVIGTAPDTRYQYAGGWGYESGLLVLAGAPGTAPITLQHVGHRWYDPSLGRFIQRDPIGIFGGLNGYAYCANNPLSWVDPSGLLSWLDVKTGIAEGFLWITGGRDNWLLDNPRRVRIASGIAAGVGIVAGGGALVCIAVGFSPWLGAAALHGAHAAGPHQFRHLQIMLRTGRHTTGHIRIPLPKGILF
ncbi:MAG TPA: RHS repeat-associated core domain-containing protein [Phycisphaerae bacterium]|nr:RHS repeat-associated core domain-containing protein [Phycisphaerae bacterium]